MQVLTFDISGDQIDGARDYQEDAFLITHLSNEDDDPQALVVVADGMGGHAAGNVASNMAVQAFNKHVSSNYPVEDSSLIPDILRTSVVKANDALNETVKETAALAGMGCTMVGILLSKGKLWWASVGDSHLYLIRDNQIRKLNADHSYGGFLDRMAEEGKHIDPDPSLSRNMLMSALTGSEIAEIDVSKEAFKLKNGDNIIVCSDGMDTLSREEILKQASWAPDAKQTAKTLLQAVEDAEKPRQDNTTIVDIRTKQIDVEKPAAYDLPSSATKAAVETDDSAASAAPESQASDTAAQDQPEKSGGGMGKIIAIVVVILVIGAAAAFFFMQSDKPQPVPMTEEMATDDVAPEAAVDEEITETPEAAVEEATSESEAVSESEPEVSDQPIKQTKHFVNPFSDSLRSGGRGPVMVTAPAGEFQMGAPSYSANIDERPKHKVSLQEFAISQYEITFAEYEVFAKAMGKSAPERSEVNPRTYPVTNVSWQDAQDYAAWLSRQTGEKYSLPSESQWEYAARAGTDTRFWWGLDIGSGNAHCQGCGSPASLRKAAPIGSFEANPWGLYDTSGNVAEWVLDCYNRNYEGAPDDGSAWQDGDCSKRMVRGGSFSNSGDGSTNTVRKSYPAGAKLSHLGFRVVREK